MAQPATTSADATQAGHRMATTLAGRYNSPMDLGTVMTIGWRAAAVLEAAPFPRVLAPMRASIYIVARDALLWVGGPDELMHSRAVLLAGPPSAVAAGDTISLPPWTVPAWRPHVPDADARAARALRCGATRLVKMAAALGEARGFGAWLVGSPLAFPLSGAGQAADALAAACARDDARAATDAALGMLGLGAGLTPSGDDFVGGAFFARAMLTQLGAADDAGWREAATTVRAAANLATTPISATLLSDLIEGHGWSPLHDLVGALVSGDDSAALKAASHLTRLGHSSGWDLLAGFVAGAAR
jgi:hypothetical protein